MSYRFMRIIVFFDLPTETNLDRKEYRVFRKFLITEGFIMMQQSVYSKIALNTTTANAIKRRIKKNKPKKGLVQVLTITEKQFNSIDTIVGKSISDTVSNDERIIEL